MSKQQVSTLSHEVVAALASSAIPSSFTVGKVQVAFEELVELTVAKAWALCDEDETEFLGFVDKIAEAAAILNGVANLELSEQIPAIRQAASSARETNTQAVLGLIINNAIKNIHPPQPLPAATTAAWNKVRKGSDQTTLCHAPSTNLYFARDGAVGVCCYSRLNPVGRIPEQTIAEIWSGLKVRTMRQRLAESILPVGCEICAEQILAHNFAGLMAANFEELGQASVEQQRSAPPSAVPSRFSFSSLFRRMPSVKPVALPTAAAPAYPLQMEFELSNKCNLECSMCSGFFSSSIRSNRENKPPLPMVYDANFVQQLREFVPHLKSAKFLGGEPFLIDIYYDIWELFIELNPTCEISITTNANVFTARAQRVVERLNCNIAISFDSITKPIYESIRVNANFERTLENLETIRKINREKGKTAGITVCPIVTNWQQMPDLVTFANQRQMTIYFNTVINP